MIVYSNKIIRFVKEIKETTKKILTNEVGVKVAKERFYDRQEKYSYPLKIVIFSHKSMLGYFLSDFFEMGFHECLMHTTSNQLHDIIRHELAHYLCFINFGANIPPHGTEYKTFCERLGWGENVWKASTCLEKSSEQDEESPVLRKIQKLMALTRSNNSHEAEQAMLKSQELLLKHNINTSYLEGEDEEPIYLKRIYKQKKETAKMRAIATILDTFFVNVIYTRATDAIYLEIMGSAVNLEIAEHVTKVLEVELENLWEQAKETASLKGKVAKNSFFTGFAKGYCNKVQALKKEYDQQHLNALMVIEKKLESARALIYPRLSYSARGGNFCAESATLGEKLGKAFSINPAIKTKETELKLLT